MGRPEGKRPLVRPGRRWEDNTKRDRQEVGWGSIHWFDPDRARQQALVNVVMNFWIA